jgi:hypothetical protein
MFTHMLLIWQSGLCWHHHEPHWKMWPTNCLCITITQQCWMKSFNNWKGGICNGVCFP